MGETGPVTDSGKGVQSPLARYQSPKDNMLLPEASIGVSATKHIFMKKITVTIHNGKITGAASGYLGKGCEAPLAALKDALGGNVKRDEATAEASLTEDPLTQDNTAFA